MTQPPQGIQDQVQQVVRFFAKTLTEAELGELPEVPDWLSDEAQSWIVCHHSDFSELVVSAYREFRG